MKKCIDFLITQKCNYKCPYCSQSKGYYKDFEEADDETIEAFLKFITKLPRDFEITISGGEPLTHKKFFYLIEKIKELGFRVSIVSNFSYSIETYKKIKDILGDNLSELFVSLHLSQIKDLYKFLLKAFKFNYYKKSSKFTVGAVLTNENLEKLKFCTKYFKDNNIDFELQHMRIKNSFVEYDKEAQEFIEGFPISKIRKNSKTYGKTCLAGMNFLVVYQDGEVYRCYSSRFNKVHSLGNIKNGVKMYDMPLPCLNKNCTCPKPIINGMVDYNSNNFFKAALLSLYNLIFIPYFGVKNFDILKAKIKQGLKFKNKG